MKLLICEFMRWFERGFMRLFVCGFTILLVCELMGLKACMWIYVFRKSIIYKLHNQIEKHLKWKMYSGADGFPTTHANAFLDASYVSNHSDRWISIDVGQRHPPIKSICRDNWCSSENIFLGTVRKMPLQILDFYRSSRDGSHTHLYKSILTVSKNQLRSILYTSSYVTKILLKKYFAK